MANGAKSLAHVLAAVVVAFAMAPRVEFRKAWQISLSRHTTARFSFDHERSRRHPQIGHDLPDLLERFARTIAGSVATDKVLSCCQHNSYSQHYPCPR